MDSNMGKVILGIETSAVLCSVAWLSEGKILMEKNIEKPNIHATLLADMVASGFTALNIKKKDISLVAVASGPGSFTGLRIGMSYAKGFCYGGNIPIIGITNFEILLKQAPLHAAPVYVLISAGHGRYYCGIFKDGIHLSGAKMITLEQTAIIPERSFVVLMGDSGEENLQKKLVHSIHIIQGKYSGALVCQIAIDKFARLGADNLDTLEPFYLQSFAGLQ
jgi:tRNA threonylcarbamoyladenosine biosynthesis protein TsaB